MKAIPLLIAAFACQLLSAQEKLLPVLHFNHIATAAGLPSAEIRSRVVRDHLGYAWVGTVNGLARYDGITSRTYGPVPGDLSSYASRGTNAILLDSKNRLWLGGWQQGLSLYDRERDRFLNFGLVMGGNAGYRPVPVRAICEDRSGGLWLGTEGGGVVCVTLPGDAASPENLAAKITFKTYQLGTPRNAATDVYQRGDRAILIASDQGVLLIDPSTQSLSRPPADDPLGHRLGSLSIERLFEDSRKNLWIATSTEGLCRLDGDGHTLQVFRHRDGDTGSLRSDVVWDIAEAPDGRLWVGTDLGVDILSPVSWTCEPYVPTNPAPGVSALTRISFDRTGIAWIGTASDGLFQHTPKSRRIPCYTLPRGTTSPRAVHHVERAEDGTLWLTSEGDLVRLDADTRTILGAVDVFKGKRESFQMRTNNQAWLDHGSVFWWGTWGLGVYRVALTTGDVKNFTYHSPSGQSGVAVSVVPGEQTGTVWVATYYDGLMSLDSRSGKFTRVPAKAGRNMSQIMKDRSGRLWLASETAGMGVYHPATGAEVVYNSDPADSLSLSQTWARGAYQDPEGRIWIGAGNVVHRWNSAARSFTRFVNREYSNALFNMPLGTDRSGRLWISLSSGTLSLLDPTTGIFTNLDPSDGTCGEVIDMQTLPDGRVVLTGALGINIVNPDSISLSRPPPPLRITRLSVNDELHPYYELAAKPGGLRLDHSQNVLEIEFAALDLEAPGGVDYHYRLAGLEQEWVHPQGRRYVRYSGLAPGSYTFKLRATSIRNEWPDQAFAFVIRIAAPWWRTPWAYAAYGLIVVSLMYGTYRVRISRVRLEQQAAMEHFQAERLAEADRLRSRFFANISHEFRTPLTLILGPIRKWKEKAHEDEEAKDLGLAERNTDRLLGLVNQLLDLSRIEAGAMRARARRMNVVPLVKGIANSFESSADIRGITLRVDYRRDTINAFVDGDMLGRILTNLLSNAFKFTREGGQVTVTADVDDTDGTASAGGEPERGSLRIAVSDTGIGIPPEEIPRLFDRFYQVDSSQTRAYEGSGIGLALVKELVEIHRGSIDVRSEVGRGSEFILRLPLGRQHLRDDEIDSSAEEVRSPEPAYQHPEAAEGTRNGLETTADKGESSGKPVVLVVEDNADMRSYIKSHLTTEYTVIEAVDGVEGLDRAREAIPDLIISDIMMPRMDGNQLCQTLQGDEKTSHIPIILLTAKAGSEHRIEGLEAGADDYVIKPFEPRELAARARNLIEGRRRLRERFKVPLRPGDIAVTSMEDAFLKKAIGVVDKRMEDEDFGVEELGKLLAMSRVQLHRKITALTNHPPGEFIRYLRLHRAMDLLKNDAGTVSEVAYRVGFGDPSHFTRRFREQFGILPSEIRKHPPAM